MFNRNGKRTVFGAGRVTIHEPDVEYLEQEDFEMTPKRKKKKYLPGERLLIKLDKERRRKCATIDTKLIQRSMSELIEDLTKL